MYETQYRKNVFPFLFFSPYTDDGIGIFCVCVLHYAPLDEIIFTSIYIFYRLSSFCLLYVYIQCTQHIFMHMCVSACQDNIYNLIWELLEQIFGFHFWGFFTYFLFLPVFHLKFFYIYYTHAGRTRNGKWRKKNSLLLCLSV